MFTPINFYKLVLLKAQKETLFSLSFGLISDLGDLWKRNSHFSFELNNLGSLYNN